MYPGVEIYILLGLHVQPQLQKRNPNECECNPNLEEGLSVGLKGPSFGLRGPSFVLIAPCVGLKGHRFCLRRTFQADKYPLSAEKTLFLPLSALFDVGLVLTLTLHGDDKDCLKKTAFP